MNRKGRSVNSYGFRLSKTIDLRVRKKIEYAAARATRRQLRIEFDAATASSERMLIPALIRNDIDGSDRSRIRTWRKLPACDHHGSIASWKLTPRTSVDAVDINLTIGNHRLLIDRGHIDSGSHSKH